VAGRFTSEAVSNRNWRAFLMDSAGVTDLGVPGGAVTSISADGTAAGFLVTGERDLLDRPVWHAFRFAGGRLTDLGTLGGQHSQAMALNAQGVIVGWAHNSLPRERAVSWGATGIVDLGSLGGDTGCSRANGINPRGVIVGQSCMYDQRGTHIGYRAVRFRAPGVLEELGTLKGSSFATAINESGLIVGAAEADDGTVHAVVYADGRVVDAGSLPDSSQTWLQAVNARGTAVGWTSPAHIEPGRGLIWGEGQLFDLNGLIDGSAGTVTRADSISDDGQIAAQAVIGGVIKGVILRPH
jgi:probable HAF family extracellular repeat protein